MQSSAPYRPPLPRANAANGASVNGRCPLLGTPADTNTSLSFPSDANHCFSTRFAVPISTIHQENYCLSDHYGDCPVYRQRQQADAVIAAPLMAAVAVGPLLGADGPSAPEWDEPEPVSAAAVAAMSAAGAAAYAPTPPAPLFNWEQPTHPDFQADMDAAAARRRPARGVDSRAVLVALLLLALIPLAWWAWTALRSGTPQATAPGTVVTLPTSRADSGQAALATTGAGGIAVLPDATATSTATPPATAGGAVEPVEPATITPIPTMSQLEGVAATATALFLNATVVTECAAPDWWVAYTVEAGDTIETLAAQRGIRPEELIVANCLAGPELTPGALLRLPPVGVIVALPATVAPTSAAPTPMPSRTAGPTRFPVLPTPPVVIIFPTPTFPIFGTATAEPPDQPTDSPPRPTARPTQAPTSAVPPTATPPNPFPTATSPGNRPTATPPVGQPTATPPGAQPSRTPPGNGNNPTPTGTPTRTPPAITPNP